MGSGQHGFERIGPAVVEQFDFLINAAERRRVEAFVAIAWRRETKIVNLTIRELRAAVTGDAGGFFTFEQALPALGGCGERTVVRSERIGRRLKLLQISQ